MTTGEMPPLSATANLELTLIVAATARDMGIGAHGGLPWTGLRREMAYFARVTKRGDNAVVMGRRTWESIPLRFRPLPNRLNVVISRAFAPGLPQDPVGGPTAGPVEAASLDMALAYLRTWCSHTSDTGTLGTDSPKRRVFVIGGAQLYAAALARPEARRVLLTRVHANFTCDTFFPLALGTTEVPPSSETAPTNAQGWAQCAHAAHAAWVGEDVPTDVQTENETDYVFEMWERDEGGASIL